MSENRVTQGGTFRQTPAGALLHAVEQLSGAGAIEDVVEVVRKTTRRLIGSDGIAVILRDGDTCHYVEEDSVGPLWKGRRFPLASCISGWTMLHRETAVIPDISEDSRIPYDLYRDTFVRSLVMAPVRSNDPIGAIGAYWSQAYQPTADEVETLETVARAAATAVENVRLVSALSRALTEAELARDELRHRVKNAFTAAQALASLTLPPDHARALSARLAALGRAHDLIDQRLAREASITLKDLVQAELEPYETESPARVSIQGQPITLQSAQAVALGLALNELATNALKYGALSTPKGRLAVRWRFDADHLILDWTESDGPEVRAAAVENFGSRLLKRLVEGQLKGSLSRSLDRGGVTCTMEFPMVLTTEFSGA
jgi:two-component sensor histidine kinase